MKSTIQTVVMIVLSVQMLTLSGLRADDEKVPEEVKQDVIDSEKKTQEQEESETGESFGNVEDCEQANESEEAGDSVEEKDLDECEPMEK